MHDLTPRIISILGKYMRDPAAPVEDVTTLRELEIDQLDLPMIFLDVEDVFDVQVGYGDEIDDFPTVLSLVARVADRLEEKARPRTQVRRPKRSWMSTGAERQR
jgi:acyl carrier protein